jgi:mRNA-degrading endonuclease toxin of MazEF toxin-antitoxin module
MSIPCRGRMVWVEVPDPQGGNPKCRPAIILTPTDEIKQDGDIVIVAVSTQVDAAPAATVVNLPWHRDGHPKTGLKAPSVAVCNWVQQVKLTSIRDCAGIVPGKQLLEIEKKVRMLLGE